MSEDALVHWYEGVQRASGLPVFAYNIPQYAANTVALSVLTRLFADGIIAGVKDSTGQRERVAQLVTHFGGQGTVFAASDGFAREGRELGADGFISAIGNVFPRLLADVWNGDDAKQQDVTRIRQVLKTMGSLPALKFLLTQQGFAFGASRLPYSDLTPEQEQTLSALL